MAFAPPWTWSSEDAIGNISFMYAKISSCVTLVTVKSVGSSLRNFPANKTTYSRAMSTMKQSNLKQWRFAPLDESSQSPSGNQVKLLGVVFDVDGTLCMLLDYGAQYTILY